MKRIFSGVQPTGNLHLGNYLGAIKNWVSLQESFECIFCIVDLHALTVKQDPKELENNTLEVTAAYLAAGIDPKKTIIFKETIKMSTYLVAFIIGPFEESETAVVNKVPIKIVSVKGKRHLSKYALNCAKFFP